jgi:hypothetical protein
MFILRLVLWCFPTTSQSFALSFESVDLPRMRPVDVSPAHNQGETADPVAVVSRFGDLKPAAPLPAKMTAYLDRGPNRELPPR